MNLLFFSEARLGRTLEGKYYGADQSFSYGLFERYLKVFESILVVARSTAVSCDSVDENTRVDNVGVSVLPLPYYIGPYQYIVKRNKLLKVLRCYIDSNPNTAIIIRIPGVVGTAVAKYLFKKKRPYGVEVVGDPSDVFAAGSCKNLFRIIFKYSGTKNMKSAVTHASAVIYVTKEYLQSLYPSVSNVFTTYASDVQLLSDAFVVKAKELSKVPPYSVVVVGTLDALYKSPDIAIEAITILIKRGFDISLKWLGDGRYRSKMEDLARQACVLEKINFVGKVNSADGVRRYLDEADLFVLPSRVEGLPRALVEAMARGLPCIGTEVGGIPELLDKNVLVPINNAELLAEKIENLLSEPERADFQAKRNLNEAQNYAFEILEPRRIKFYQYLKSIS